MSMIRLNQTKAPCVFYNLDHFYEPLKAMLKKMLSEDFVDDQFMEAVHFCSTLEEIEEILRTYDCEVQHG